ncbi:MAG: hypothetical protein ACHQET_08380 [Chitinophagales bacterium]
MINFCTLFDSNYLTRGLAMYDSLLKNSSSFHLYVLAFDDHSLHWLSETTRPHLTAISLKEFEDEKLLKVKSERTNAEYCWTCTPSIILYCLKKLDLPSCTYVDADMIFYEDPLVLINEAGASSIIISEHRYTREYDVSLTHGIYCVQFMYFKSNEEGLGALNWWREKCLEWCFAYLDHGRFGDQKYLDDWTTRFRGVHVMQHPGGGIAPWNIQQYEFAFTENKIKLRRKNQSSWESLIFFHFHGLKFYSDQKVSYTGTMYEIDPTVNELIYRPYVNSLENIQDKLCQEGIRFIPNGARKPAPSKLNIFAQFLKERILLVMKGKISIFDFSKFDFRKYYHFYTIHQPK